MTEYVAGFMFNGYAVALVKKNRPTWQAGKYNGIGGHVEEGEMPSLAMMREFQEETGYASKLGDWAKFAVLEGYDWKVHFYQMEGDVHSLLSMTDEEIVVVNINDITVENSIPNLSWLIPMARTMPFERASLFTIQEGLPCQLTKLK